MIERLRQIWNDLSQDDQGLAVLLAFGFLLIVMFLMHT